MLDCGEGILNQIRHLYGEKWTDVLRKLKAVFISHYHGDHHQGLFSVLDAKKQFCPDDCSTVLMVPSTDIESWLSYPCEQRELITNGNILIANEQLVRASPSSTSAGIRLSNFSIRFRLTLG